VTRCDDRASFMEYKFNGGDCGQSFNIQEADQFECTDFLGGPPTTGASYLYVTAQKDPSVVYFSGFVNAGDNFPLTPPPGDNIEADSTVQIFNGLPPIEGGTGTLLQQSDWHTSCSQNIFLKDRFGGIQLVLFINDLGVTSCFVDVNFGFFITNEGASGDAVVTDFTTNINGETFDLLPSLPGPVPPNGSMSVSLPYLIDMTVRQLYTVSSFIGGVTTDGQDTCQDEGNLAFIAGNPSIAPPTCNLQVDVSCSTSAATVDGSGNCDATYVTCDEAPFYVGFRYYGGACEPQSSNSQPGFTCEDVPFEPIPSTEYAAYIIVEGTNPEDTYWDGWVVPGDLFPMFDPSGNAMSGLVNVTIYEDDTLEKPCQRILFDISCEAPLVLNDRFGALEVFEFFTSSQQTVSSELAVDFAYTITNAGASDSVNLASFATVINDENVDLLPLVPSGTIDPDDTIQVTVPRTISLGENIITTSVDGNTLVSNEQCSDIDQLTFVAGA